MKILQQFLTLRLDRVRLLNASLLTLLFIYFQWVYPDVICQLYAYGRFEFSFHPGYFAEANLLFLFSLVLLNLRHLSGFMYAVIFMLILLMLMPGLVVFEYMQTTRMIPYTALYTLILLCLFSYPRPVIRGAGISPKKQMLFFVITAVVFILPFVLTFRTDIHLRLLLFQDVYETRASAAEKMNMPMGYAYQWLIKIILPLLIAISFFRKKILIFLISLLFLLYLYLVTGHKSAFLTIFIVVLFYFFSRYELKMSFLLLLFFGGILISRFAVLGFEIYEPESVFLRRLFFDPAMTNVEYFDYFSERPMLLSHSFLSGVFQNPLEQPPERIISALYGSSPEGNANNGFISDAFMNFGIAGLLIFPALFALLFAWFDALRMNARLFGVVIVILYTFLSSFFFTAFLTHGVFLMIAVSWLFLSNTEGEDNKTLKPSLF